ncbi:hypothetical protein BUALT_Bualt07G0121800 [Buddleja alternifolia]|uniref:30S ribosomal protein S15, chloroplastic n=1 Tax=Buddleja alternifolia TaxID=168488 RepID=A0AAV6XKR3_9LAMI|nr:hypothetical protein BUALT_Bualt07G0121800 [Buddleja alternifolia]
MAVITARLLHLRPILRPHPYPLHHFSSSPPPDPPDPTPPPSPSPEPSISSYLSDVKATLRREPPPQNRPQTPRKPLSFSNPTPHQTPPPSRVDSLDEIRRNLSAFRSRSAPPPPSSGQYISLQELYKRNVIPNSDASNTTTSSDSNSASVTPNIGQSFDTIRESLRQLRSTSPAAKIQNDPRGKPFDPISLARFKETLKHQNVDPMIVGGSDSLPTSIFGKEKISGDDNVGGEAAMRTAFVKMYDVEELGKKLKMLRPEKKKGKWFSLHELNERLAKLREVEEKEYQGRVGGASFKDLRDTLLQLKKSDEEQVKNKTAQRLGVLSQLGVTPTYMLSPPKDNLVEKIMEKIAYVSTETMETYPLKDQGSSYANAQNSEYFHPDNMSSAEKLKLELKKVRDEFKMSESDCGSARVQGKWFQPLYFAQLTTKIKHLSTVLQKKDKHSRKGLQAMVQRRKKLLKYLRRTDWDSYSLVLSKLGLRDNPDIKA